MDTVQFSSLDLAALGGQSNAGHDVSSSPPSMARRSLSIFSRRGTETPEPLPPFIAQAAMDPSSPKKNRADIIAVDGQRSWRLSRTGNVRRKSRGTVLHAVPESPKLRMTALELEMSTSPNAEIVASIGQGASPTQLATASSVQSTPTQLTSFWTAGHVPLAERTRSQKRRDTNARIGVWVDGIICWDTAPNTDRLGRGSSVRSQLIADEAGMHTLTSIPPKASKILGIERPSLSVQIPECEPLTNTPIVSAIVHPVPKRPVVSVAPASIINKYIGDSHVIPSDDSSCGVSPLNPEAEAPPSALSPASPPTPTGQPVHFQQSSSSQSSSADHADTTSIHSKRSSATSIEVLTMKHTADQPTDAAPPSPVMSTRTHDSTPFDRELGTDKPLPPLPGYRPSGISPSPPPTPLDSTKPYRRKPTPSYSVRSAPAGRKSQLLRVRKPMRPRRSLPQLSAYDRESVHHCSCASSVYSEVASNFESGRQSPTFSLIEVELETQLASLQQQNNVSTEENGDEKPLQSVVSRCSSTVRRSNSVHSVMQPPERPPTLPKRSRKREWYKPSGQIERVAKANTARFSSTLRRKSDSNLNQSVRSEENPPTTRHVRRISSVRDTPRISTHTQNLHVASDGEQEMFVVSHQRYMPFVYDDGLCVVEGPVIVPQTVDELPEEEDEQVVVAYDGEGVTDVTIRAGAEDAALSASAAEQVLLQILASLNTLQDLANTSIINKGMRRVYMENDMFLIKAVCFNQSPALWELREWCPPERTEAESSKDSLQLEHTPKTFMHCYKRDLGVVDALKKLILTRCQTFLRSETAQALADPTHASAQRFDDAFWRIWCFCKIFGCGKEREEDVTGQIDWLKGGILANNQGFSATVNTNLDYDMGSVLLNPPEHFAKGNSGGVAGKHLYDMMEIWTCLSALLSEFHGHVQDAEQHGVFTGCNIPDDDAEQQQLMLEEWISYLLTLGPAAVLDMAELGHEAPADGFAHAKAQGWTDWKPALSTRTTFLKEPVSRLYEERVAAAARAQQTPKQMEKKEISRKRVANLAAEIRVRRQMSVFKRSPFISMAEERPMSALARNASIQSAVSSGLASSYVISPMPSVASLARGSNAPSGRLSPTMVRKISPIIEDRVETFNKMAMQSFDGIASDTAERAVHRIVDLGFTPRQAQDALRITDMGDGLRVDRAVDYLLRLQ